VRWHIRALGVTQLALVTQVHDLADLAVGEAGDLFIAVGVHELKQLGKRRAKVETQAATVADVKDSFYLFIQGCFVPKLRGTRVETH
jgi:hypothetical protein